MRRAAPHKRKRTTWRLLLVIIVPVVIGLGIFGLTRILKNTNTSFSVKPLSMSATNLYAYNGSGLLYIENGKLSYEDLADAKKNYSNAVSTDDVKLAASQNISALYNSGAVQIIGTSTPIEVGGTVVSVRCGANHLAVLRRDSAGALSLLVYSSSGAQIDQMDFSKAFLVDFGFASQQSDAMWTLTLDDTGSLPINTLTTYDLAKAATTGVMTLQGHLVEKLRFTQNSIFAVGTNNLIRYNNVGNSEAYRLLVYGWQYADSYNSGSTAMFLFTSRDTQSSTVRLYTVLEADAADEKLASVRLPGDVHTFFLASGKLIAVAADKVYIFSSSGKLSETLPLEMPVDSANKLSDNSALLFSGSSTYLITFK